MFKKFLIVIISIVSIFSFAACNRETKEDKILTRTELFMGTAIKVSLYDGGSEKVLDKVFDRVLELENLVSINKEGTEIDELNKNAGIKSVKLSDDSKNIIEKGLYYSSLSSGGYDISIGSLVKLWSIGLPEAKIPTESEIKESLENINYKDVEINGNEVFLKKKGMLLDLGSIAKGYAADEIAKILVNEGVEKAIIDLGGNIYALGKKSEESPWKIGVQNPFDDRGNIVGTLLTENKSVVTTGIYERFIEDGDKKYHHVLNPKTGYPYNTDIVGVTIIADKSIDADALSTLVFTMGIQNGIEFIENMENVDAIFITNNKNVYKTNGIKESFNVTNDEFKLVN